MKYSYLRLWAPVGALIGWAVTAAVGVDPSVVQVAGPAALAAGCAIHIGEEVRLIRGGFR